jgi:hypothetical protein
MAQLCPQCLNASDYCECEPRFVPPPAAAAAESTPQDGHQVSIADVVKTVVPGRRVFVEAFLDGVAQLGGWLETPSGARGDYVNVRTAPSDGPYRLCSVNRTSGRIEFQSQTSTLARRNGLDSFFDSLADGDKAAVSPSDHAHVEAAIGLAKLEISRRRSQGW